MQRHVSFVLPRSLNVPIGGYKIVFQYANYLALHGFKVDIYFLLINVADNHKPIFLRKLNGLLNQRQKYRKIDWFHFSDGVQVHFDVTEQKIQKISDGAVIATNWTTARCVFKSEVDTDSKFYLLQGFEIFDPDATKDIVIQTWKLPLQKIVISKWLLRKAKELGVEATLIPNFIDLNEFRIRKYKTNVRRGPVVSFLWHENPQKQSQMAVNVCRQLKECIPDLSVLAFGTTPLSQNASLVVDHYFQDADPQTLSNRVYGQSAVYIMPSSSEGWGLTGLEAMACGAAVVSVDNGGIHEYAINGESAIIVDNDEKELFKATKKTLLSIETRKLLESSGKYTAYEYSLENSGHNLAKLLEKSLLMAE